MFKKTVAQSPYARPNAKDSSQETPQRESVGFFGTILRKVILPFQKSSAANSPLFKQPDLEEQEHDLVQEDYIIEDVEEEIVTDEVESAFYRQEQYESNEPEVIPSQPTRREDIIPEPILNPVFSFTAVGNRRPAQPRLRTKRKVLRHYAAGGYGLTNESDALINIPILSELPSKRVRTEEPEAPKVISKAAQTILDILDDDSEIPVNKICKTN